MNPGGSVKDRAALGLVQWAEKTGTQFLVLSGSKSEAREVGCATCAGGEGGRQEHAIPSALTDLRGTQARSNREARSSKAPRATRASGSRTSAVRAGTSASSTCRMCVPPSAWGARARADDASTKTQSQEKIDLLRMLGAEVHPVPGECSLACEGGAEADPPCAGRSGRFREPGELQPPCASSA